MDLSISSLDDPSAFGPSSHFSIETRIVEWHAEDGLPGQRFDACAPIVERWKQACGDEVTPSDEAARRR